MSDQAFSRTRTKQIRPYAAHGNKRAAEPEESRASLLIFDRRVKTLFATLLTLLVITTAFKINGSSIAAWNALFGFKTDTGVILGKPRGMRIDEWSLHTPALLSQSNSARPFSTSNYSLGAYQAPLVMNLPVRHWSAVFRPQFWLFFFIDAERAFAFYWNLKLVLTIGGVFLLLMLLLDNNFAVSLIGALWVHFSAFLQWWYSSPQVWPELVGFFALFTSSMIYILLAKRRAEIVAAAAGAPVFYGTKYVPDLEELKVLSREKSDFEIYNRYGFITLMPTQEQNNKFEMGSTPDTHVISIDPMSAQWRQLNITHYFFYSVPLDGRVLGSMQPVVRTGNYSIFRYR